MREKLKAKFTMLFSKDGLKIEIQDELSREYFLKLEVNAKDTCAAMGRLACVDAEYEIYNLECIGKKMEHKYITFELKKQTYGEEGKKVARKEAEKYVPKGWILDDNLTSQDSFYLKDNKWYCKALIRRYIGI